MRSFRQDKDDINKNFKVAIRVRPPLPRELEGDRFINCVKVVSAVVLHRLAKPLVGRKQSNYYIVRELESGFRRR